MYNILNQKINKAISFEFVGLRKLLSYAFKVDKVMHKLKYKLVGCNTLSRGQYDKRFRNQRTNHRPFCKATMPDDRTTGGQTEIFYSIGSPLSCNSGILQKLYSKREMVYTPLDPQIQSGGTLVLQRNRLFPGRQSDKNIDCPCVEQPRGTNCRTVRRKAPLSMSHSFGSVVQEKKIATPEDRTFIYLSLYRSSHCQKSAPSFIRTKCAYKKFTSRNCSFGSGGIYSQSRIRFYAVSQNDQMHQENHRRGCTDRRTFSPVWFKKNDVNCGQTSWRALNTCLQKLALETLPAALFPKPPIIRFVSEKTVCHCGTKLVVQKTRRKTVLSMTGPFVAHETILRCLSCSSIFNSDALLRQVPKWCNVGYDVLVYVGRALFQRHRTIHEVSTELYSRNVLISASEISHLGYKFISSLAACHQRAIPTIRQSMVLSGGYVLHLDATHEGDAPALMTGMDSLSEIVLGNVKIPSEKSDYIVPFLQKLKKEYGTPRACVHDMGKGICKAVSEVYPVTPDFICHFHFLRDIGKDILEPAYSSIRLRMRKHKTSSRLHALAREVKQQLSRRDSYIKLMAKALLSIELPENSDMLPLVSVYSMTLWMLNGKNSGDGYGFPFDRPLLIFAKRLSEGQKLFPDLSACCHNTDKVEKKSVNKLIRIVSDIINDTHFQQGIQELNWRCQVFDDLRKAMRIALPGGKEGINDDGANESISTICANVRRFRRKLDKNAKWSDDELCRKMAKQIDKWNEKLFADPIQVDTPRGPVIIYPQRTNNILEQFFRGFRRGQRRKTGNNSLRHMLQTMLSDTPLVKNLDNDKYMKILLDGRANLEELFADSEIAATSVSANLPAEVDFLLPGFRKLIKQNTFPGKLAKVLSKNKIMAESN